MVGKPGSLIDIPTIFCPPHISDFGPKEGGHQGEISLCVEHHRRATGKTFEVPQGAGKNQAAGRCHLVHLIFGLFWVLKAWC